MDGWVDGEIMQVRQLQAFNPTFFSRQLCWLCSVCWILLWQCDFLFLSLSLLLKKKNFHRKARAGYQMHIFECLRLGNCKCTAGIVTLPTQRTQAKNPAGVYVVLVLVPSRLWGISQQCSAELNCTFKKEKPFPPPPPASVPSVGMLLRTN